MPSPSSIFFGALATVELGTTTYVFYIGDDLTVWYFTVDNLNNPNRTSQSETQIAVNNRGITPASTNYSSVSYKTWSSPQPTFFGIQQIPKYGFAHGQYNYCCLAAAAWPDGQIHVFYPKGYGDNLTLAEIVYNPQTRSWGLGTVDNQNFSLHVNTFLSCTTLEVYYIDPTNTLKSAWWENMLNWKPGYT